MSRGVGPQQHSQQALSGGGVNRALVEQARQKYVWHGHPQRRLDVTPVKQVWVVAHLQCNKHSSHTQLIRDHSERSAISSVDAPPPHPKPHLPELHDQIEQVGGGGVLAGLPHGSG